MIVATRYHDISCGHRVANHESKCAHLHGHNYRITFECAAEELDNIGRVLDFSVIKSTLCEWLEANWDHHFLIWSEDPIKDALTAIDSTVVVVPLIRQPKIWLLTLPKWWHLKPLRGRV